MAGENGLQYHKKSFSVAMGGNNVFLSPEEIKERDQLKAEREAKSKAVQEQTKQHLNKISTNKVTRKLIPYGQRILVKRRKVEDKSSHIILPDEVKNLPTDIADIIAVPDQSFCDATLIKNAEKIISGLDKRAQEGDGQALDALMRFNEYLRVMTLKPGDVLLMARYGGTDFLIQETNQTLCVTDANGIYALVVEKKG